MSSYKSPSKQPAQLRGLALQILNLFCLSLLLTKALNSLDAALALPLNDIVRDAVIQRFEYTFELSWKTLKVASEYMGMECRSPRETIKAGFKFTWIQSPDLWFEAMEARNKTSHTYDEDIAREVYEVAGKFSFLVKELIAKLGGL